MFKSLSIKQKRDWSTKANTTNKYTKKSGISIFILFFNLFFSKVKKNSS